MRHQNVQCTVSVRRGTRQVLSHLEPGSTRDIEQISSFPSNRSDGAAYIFPSKASAAAQAGGLAGRFRNAAQMFQRVFHEVIRGLDFVFSYVDDIFIASSTPEKHRTHLRQLFEKLQQYHLAVNVAKYEFGRTEITSGNSRRYQPSTRTCRGG